MFTEKTADRTYQLPSASRFRKVYLMAIPFLLIFGLGGVLYFRVNSGQSGNSQKAVEPIPPKKTTTVAKLQNITGEIEKVDNNSLTLTGKGSYPVYPGITVTKVVPDTSPGANPLSVKTETATISAIQAGQEVSLMYDGTKVTNITLVYIHK